MEPPVSILDIYSIAAWNVTYVKGPMYGVTGNFEYNLPSGVYIICSSVHCHCAALMLLQTYVNMF